MPGESFQSLADAVIQSAASAVCDDEHSISTMRGVDGTSWNNGTPAGVSFRLQIKEQSVEPMLANRGSNLLSHKDQRTPCTDESKLVVPKIPLVVKTTLLARDAERLARERPTPDFAVVGPSGETGSKRPPSDAGEEVALPVSHKVVCSDINNAPGIHVAGWNVAGCYEVA